MGRGRAFVVLLATLALVVGCGSGHRSDGASPSSAPGPSASDAAWTAPRFDPAEHLDYQLGGPSEPAEGVGTVVRDRTADPVQGLFNVCYVNAFQTQPGSRAFWRKRPGLVVRVKGRPLADPGWPDEWILDISTAPKRKRLARIVDRWVAGCAASGYDAVEYDNLDSYTRSKRRLTARNATAYARLLVASAHRHRLAAAQKNRAQWDGSKVGFDLAVTESCGEWDECGEYVDHYGDQVLVVEYDRAGFDRACAE
ncbi:MAG: endo alpha-1,4 polygalactosaminidase, partial [Nocardioides sp.]|uniref:endo alpha-1,4 polygalactosaminidase n=1 Tax=Nocardioides sp. TaxID=35761 RepID=UPI003F00215A